MITFGDAAQASNLIGKYTHVALYGNDCAYPCPSEVSSKWGAEYKRWITFSGNPGHSILDFEEGTAAFAKPNLVASWLKARQEAKQERPAWIYCDLSNAQKAADAADGYPFHWWLSTLDGVNRSPAELSALLVLHGVPLELTHASLIDAQQVSTLNDDTDKSICFGNW